MFGILRKIRERKIIREHREKMKSFEARIAMAREKHQPIRHIEAERQDYVHGLLAKRGALTGDDSRAIG